MSMLTRLTLPLSTLLLAATALAQAESPLPDPIAPAVIGRPIPQARVAGTARGSTEAKTERAPQARTREAREARAAKAATARPARSAQANARPPAAAARAIAAAPVAPAQALGAGAAQAPEPGQRPAKQAVDDRADPRMQLDDVGKGTHFARKPLGTGAFFGQKQRLVVQQYFEEHPAPATKAGWQVGEPVPKGAPLSPLPDRLLTSLPPPPPGYIYVQWAGDLVLVAQGSRMVVDGISRSPR